MPGWMLSFTVYAFVSFTVTFSGGVVFAAFPTYFVKTFARRSMMTELLAFVTLDQLKLRVVFLWVESLVIDVESAFDAFVCCFWAGEKCYESEVSSIVPELSS